MALLSQFSALYAFVHYNLPLCMCHFHLVEGVVHNVLVYLQVCLSYYPWIAGPLSTTQL